MKFLRAPLLVLVNGYILMFYSELVFWARPQPEDTPLNWISTWLAYSLLGFLFLASVRHFHVRDSWTLYLCGALFGWLGEGVLVQTMYDSFPLQISWTALAWHALLSVWFGWYWMRSAFQGGRAARLVWTSLGFGLGWGFWAVFWWFEDPGAIASWWTFTRYAFLASILLGAAYFLFDRLDPALFRPPRWVLALAVLLVALLFAFVSVPAVPLAPAVLLPLLGLVLIALSRNKRARPEGSLLETANRHVPACRYLAPLLAALSASLFYFLASCLPWHLPTGWLVYGITTPLGAILLVIGLMKTWRSRPVGPAVPGGDAP